MTDTIKAVAGALANVMPLLDEWTHRKLAQAAIEAMQIREMTVEEAAEEIRHFISVSDIEFDGDGGDSCAKEIAFELAKLGCIRIVGDV